MEDRNPPLKTYALTIRPYGGITDEQVGLIEKYIRKQCEYYHLITEKTGHERHVHAGLFLKKPKTRSNFGTDMMRLFHDLSPTEKSVLRGGIKVMYNKDYISNYLDKDDDTVVVASCLPEIDTLHGWFPPPLPPKPKKKGVDLFYLHLEELWHQHKRPIEECTPENIRHFLMRMMNVERVIKVIPDNRKVFMMSCALARFINKEDTWNVDPEPFHQDK